MTAASPPVLANIGCGPRGVGRLPPMFDDWRVLRVDVDPAVEPDVITDITDLSPIRSDSIQGVWTAHCVEHLYQHQVGQALSEICRILAPEGFACIVVPDLQTVAEYIAADRMNEPLYESRAGPITPHDIVFGYGKALAVGHTFMAHRCGFTPKAMLACLADARFGEFAVVRRPNLELAAIAHKTGWRSIEERDDLVRQLSE